MRILSNQRPVKKLLMPQAADTAQLGTLDALAFFRSEADLKAPSTAGNYRKAIDTFEAFDAGRGVALADIDAPMLLAWLSALFADGYSYKVAGHYLAALSALYGAAVKQGRAPATEAFAQAKRALGSIAALDFDHKRRISNFNALCALARNAHTLRGSMALYADLLLFCIYSGGISPCEAARMHKDDPAAELTPEAAAIARRHSSANRKYIFPLDQASLTPRQLDAKVDSASRSLLAVKGVESTLPLSDTIANLWATAALHIGAAPAGIVAVLGSRPADNPAFALAPIVGASPLDRKMLLRGTAALIADNPEQWHAMRLRRSTSYAQIADRLATLPQGIAAPQLYYPCEEIARRVGKKIVFDDRPVIHDILFFKNRLTDIPALFRHIGDLAWCYTVGGPGTPYAVISDAAMAAFQRTIGIFTPGMDIYPAGSLPLAEGDRVQIIGGGFAGVTATVGSTTAADGATICRLLFFDNRGVEWRLSVDSRMVRRTN